MEPPALIARLQELLPDAGIEAAPSIDLQTTCYVSSAQLLAVLAALRDRPEFSCAFLAELTATDYWPREPRFEVTYIVVSIEHRVRVRVKVRVEGALPRLATATGLWPAANWLEREVWDLFGIEFAGHPDLRRLLMPEDWEGHPLRKDAPVQIHLKPETSQPMQVTAEEFRANVEKDRRARQ